MALCQHVAIASSILDALNKKMDSQAGAGLQPVTTHPFIKACKIKH